MDLLGMTVRAHRAEVKVTVLERAVPWTRQEAGAVVVGLQDSLSSHPQHPNILIVHGERSRADIERLITDRSFTLKVVTGMDNPELPFRPQFI